MYGARFAHVDSRLCRPLVGAGLQSDVSLTTRSELVFSELAFVLFRHLWPKRRPVEAFVEALQFNHVHSHEQPFSCLP